MEVVLKRTVLMRAAAAAASSNEERELAFLLGARVLRDGLGALTDGVLGQLTGKQKAHCSLDFPTCDRRSLVVVCKAARLGSDALEDIVDKAVHDRHSLAAHSSVWVHLLEHLVDVDGVRLLPPSVPLLLVARRTARLRRSLLGSLGRDFGRHTFAFRAVCACVQIPAERWRDAAGTRFI